MTKELRLLWANLQGGLDGLELDNTDDVIEKSIVIQAIKEDLKLLNEASEKINEKNSKLLEALNSLLNPDLEKYAHTDGCPMCDSGVLRNKTKQHWDNCNWNNARLIYNKFKNYNK